MPRSLMVTKFVPSPANSGGRQRSLAVLRELAARGEVTLCAYDAGDAEVAPLQSLGVEVCSVPWRPGPVRAAVGVAHAQSLSSGRFWSKDLAATVAAAARAAPPDIVQVEYLQMAPLASGIPARLRSLDLHNVESDLVRSFAASRSGPASLALGLEARALARLERRLLPMFHAVSVVSDRDRRLLGPVGRDALVCPNGVSLDLPEGASWPDADRPVVAFVASFDWAPNIDAAVRFSSRVWPHVVAAVPTARLLLVGRDPSPAVRELGTASITVTGTVERIEPYLSQAALTVAPLRAGGGSRLKILESLGAGRPVVATTIGASGLEDLSGIRTADGDTEMAVLIVGLLRDPGEARALGRAGQDDVQRRYSWAAALAPMTEQFDRLAPVSSSEPG